MNNLLTRVLDTALSGGKSILLLTVLVVQLLVALEWVFIVTKPSFLSVLSTSQQLLVLGLAPLPLLLLAAAAVAPWLFIAAMPVGRQVRRGAAFLALVVPTFVLGSLFMLMVDNFTNTMWGLAIEKSSGPWRWGAAVGVAGLYYLAFRTVGACLQGLRQHFRSWAWLAGSLVMASLVLLGAVRLRDPSGAHADASLLFSTLAARPNILVLGSDGLNANHMSCYGYQNATTPFLETLAPASLICENFFSNCSHTTGSLTALLTGRLPTVTRVTYPPDILRGQDAFRHLPGLLRKYGYRTAQVSIRHYGDAYDVNLRDGFDTATFRTRGSAQAGAHFSGSLGWEPSFFVETVVDRVRLRLAHLGGRSALPSAFEEAEYAERLGGHSDTQRFQELQRILRATPEPFFVHAHFMGTHGPRFQPSRRVFSAGLEQDRSWMMEFYDDAIWDFDMAVRQILKGLRQRGILDRTLVIIYSDHGIKSDSRQRAPLLWRFPRAEHTGRIGANVQGIDLAPTILSYLGAEVPAWMRGRSLLAGAPPARRPVFSTRFRQDTLERVVPGGPFRVAQASLGPPFYSVGSLSMVVGQRVFTLDLHSGELASVDLPDHTEPLALSALPTPEAARALMIAHLAAQGFDVTGLTTP